jgi:hypothetical protein
MAAVVLKRLAGTLPEAFAGMRRKVFSDEVLKSSIGL